MKIISEATRGAVAIIGLLDDAWAGARTSSRVFTVRHHFNNGIAFVLSRQSVGFEPPALQYGPVRKGKGGKPVRW